MRKFVIIFILLLSFTTFAQNYESLDKNFINELKSKIKLDSLHTALMYALQNKQFKDVFVNKEILKHHDKYFTHEIKTGRITDQKSTGRCWLYAGLNAIRPDIVKKVNIQDFEFSENYLYFWDKMEKANKFLEMVIARTGENIRSRKFQRLLGNPIEDGGYWQNFVDLIKKYGCVPYEAMPEVESNHNSRQMLANINFQLRYYAYKLKEMNDNGKSKEELRQAKKEYLKNIYKMLVLHLGYPVDTFTFKYFVKDKKGNKKIKIEHFTPISFAKKFVNENLDDYIMFANWPAREYYKYYKVESSNNLIDGTPLDFINLPMEEIKKMMVKSILADYPVNFSSDVGKQSSTKLGIFNADLYKYSWVYDIEFDYNKKINTVVRNINSTHAMVILGVDLFDNKPIKWKVENSWGTDAGDKGFFYMYDNWVDLFVVRVVVNKKFVPEKYIKILSQKPVIIPEDEPEQ